MLVSYHRRVLPLPPRAPGLPLLGSTLALVRQPLAFLLAAHAELGPIFAVHAATRRLIVMAGREANRFAGREGRELLVSWPFWGALAEHRGCPHAILAIDGPDHSEQRRLYGDVLSRKLVDRVREGCDALVREGFGAREGVPLREFEVRDQTRLLVARLVHHCLSAGAPPIAEATARALMEVFRWETNTLLYGKWPRLALRLPAYRRHLALAERFLDELAAREAEVEADALGGWFERIRAGRTRNARLFTPGDTRFALLMPFVAGVDTVGATLGFVLLRLYRDAALRERIAAEVEGAYAQGVPDSATLAHATALRGLVLECLRLYPAAFGMVRGAARAFEFEGHRVPAGSEVMVFTSATHFDARYFAAPERLDVDRHTRDEYAQKHVFMPYGAGPHVCLGAGMGEAMLMLASAAIVRHHALAPTQPQREFGPRFDPSLVLDPGYRVRRTA